MGKGGAGRGERLLVTAHMDEVGFMVTAIDADGSLRFEVVGGIDDRVLLGKAVLVGPKRLPGVIGAMPVHLVPVDQRTIVIKAARMRIDIGADSEAAAKKPSSKARDAYLAMLSFPFAWLATRAEVRSKPSGSWSLPWHMRSARRSIRSPGMCRRSGKSPASHLK